MKSRLPSCLVMLFFCLYLGFDTQAAETITIDGNTIRNCTLVELSSDGAIYQSGDTNEYHTVPWAQLTPVQQSVIRSQHGTALVNVICDARYIDGTVFHANKDGVVVQMVPKKEGEKATGANGFYQGARVITSGLVLISDLPLDMPRSGGDPIKAFGFFKKKGLFDMGIAAQEIEFLTTLKPEWYEISEWKNSTGNVMKARLLGIKGDKALFAKEDNSRFVYSLSQLDAASQKKAAEIQEKIGKFPVP